LPSSAWTGASDDVDPDAPGIHSDQPTFVGSCRQRWGRQVAYLSQFLGRTSRAHRGKAKINNKLCKIGGFDPDELDLPPKPKWMRWQTFNRAEEKFDRYGAFLDEGLMRVAARLGFRF
jgi:hypothetical protein